MKYLVVVALIVLLFVLLYRRLRPYIRSIRDFLRTIRQFQQTISSQPNQRNASAQKLVRCETCGIWIPANRAITSRAGESTYCSNECASGKPKKTV